MESSNGRSFTTSYINSDIFEETIDPAFKANEDKSRFTFGFIVCPSFRVLEPLKIFIANLFGCSQDEPEEIQKRREISEEELQHSQLDPKYFHHAKTGYPFESSYAAPTYNNQKEKKTKEKKKQSATQEYVSQNYPQYLGSTFPEQNPPFIPLDDEFERNSYLTKNKNNNNLYINVKNPINSTLATLRNEEITRHVPVFKTSDKPRIYGKDDQ